MSHMQTLLDARDELTSGSTAPSSERILESPGGVEWGRTDWQRPVGYLNHIETSARDTYIRGEHLRWTEVRIPQLWLTHRAALLLLQGMRLPQILIPNQQVRWWADSAGLKTCQVAHLLLRVDPWRYWDSAPSLTGLVFARLGAVPAGLHPSEILGALAHEVSAH